jgi:hypothetical protein
MPDLPLSRRLYDSSALALVSLAIVPLLIICAPAPAAAQQPDSGSNSGGAEAAVNSVSGRKLLEEASAISRQVSEIRGLSLEKEITKGLRNRDQLRQILIERLAEEVSEEEVENEGKVYKKLGLMPADLDYRQTLLDVLTEQIAGFYDQRAKELYIMEGIPLELQRPAMAHEIFHAIQDQHFDINRMVEPISNLVNGDFALARSALIEGDASMVMIDFSLYEKGVLPRGDVRSVIDIPMMANVLEQLTRQDVGALQKLLPDAAASGAAPVDPSELADSALANAPQMIRKLLVFPYFGGMRFVINARAGHDWQRVNAIYENAPVSTEQILHPDRYFAGDQPVLLDFRTAPVLDADQLIYDSVLGEYQMRLILEEHLLNPEAGSTNIALVDRAMLGWDGDRIRAYEFKDGGVLISHLSVWDTLADAAQYFEAQVQMMKARYPKATISRSEGQYGQSICMVAGRGDQRERIYVEQWGDLILHLEGLPTDLDDQAGETDPTAYMLRDLIMHTVERTPFEQVYRSKLRAYDAERAQNADGATSDAKKSEPTDAQR